jgi:hypothetical protein
MTRDQYAQDKHRASYWWEARKSDMIVAAEYGPGDTEYPLSSLPAAPYEFHAMAYRPGEFPNLFWQIDPGMEPIWMHIALDSLGLEGRRETYEALLFGRRHPDSREELLVVLWDGSIHGFDSLSAALSAFHA